MRKDSIGFFWQDLPPVKAPKKEKPKCIPPERTWERSDYLPGLEEARRFPVQQFEDYELAIAAAKGERLVFDIECYENYFLISFMSVISGKVIYFERTSNHTFNSHKLSWLVHAFCLVSFNGINYDVPILALALAGATPSQLKEATNQIIAFGNRPYQVLRAFGVGQLKLDHIDLIEVAPLFASLKVYGGRLHAPKMQDLPFHPNTVLSQDQIDIVRWYCVNDLTNTAYLHECLKGQIALREILSKEYGEDLRSHSDAQIAEAVIASEVRKITGNRIKRPEVEPGKSYKYRAPAFLRFQTRLMQSVLQLVQQTDFVVSEDGNVALPAIMKGLSNPGITIGGSTYCMRIGGLHSTEKKTCHFEDKDYIIRDFDVVSYYPRIILLLALFPKQLTKAFLKVYQRIVDRRLAAKKAGDKLTADALKITINGAFGKLASAFSVLYSPDLLIQVTVTGQLTLLMLIEALELQGISVVSANTDGIVIKCPRKLQTAMNSIIAQWERDTGFETEETIYKGIFSRDVNNYIAVKPDNTVKLKGAYANPWADPKSTADRLHKNPTTTIAIDAVLAFLTTGRPITQTVVNCRDITKFVSVRTVKGGAVKSGEYLGKSIRWYYAQGEEGEILYASNGHSVPRSKGAKPLLVLPKELPTDIDYQWYVNEADRILLDVGYA